MSRSTLGCVLLLLSLGTPAHAYKAGISGYSSAHLLSCTSCHSGGTAAQVVLSGPSALAPGAQGTYTATLSGGPAAVGGLDVAVVGDSTLAPGTGTQLLNGEVTHTAPLAFSGGSASWTFTVTAGVSAATLYVGCLSGNGDNLATGDGAAAASLAIQIGGVDAGSDGGSPGADAGAGGGVTVQGGCGQAGPPVVIAAWIAVLALGALRLRTRGPACGGEESRTNLGG